MFDRPVKDMMRREKLLRAPPDTPVCKAAKLMVSKSVGAVMVIADEHLVGICTERDIVFRVVAKGLDAHATRLVDVMTPGPQTIAPDKPFGSALLIMHERGFRHLPVVHAGEGGRDGFIAQCARSHAGGIRVRRTAAQALRGKGLSLSAHVRGALAASLLGTQYAVLVRAPVPGRAREAGRAGEIRARRGRPRPERNRHPMGCRQQRVDAADAKDALGCRGSCRSPVSRLVHGQLQPPVVGRHPGAAACAEPPDSDAQVLPEAAADLRAGHRPRVVGARLSVHASPFRRRTQAASGEAVRRHRGDPPGVPEVRAGADQRDELCGRHALHAGEAPQRSVRPTATCCAQGPAHWRWRWVRWATSSTRCST